MKDIVDRRVIAAVRFDDVETELPILAPLVVSAAEPLVTLLRKGRGLYVVLSAPGFEAYTATYDLDAPDAPPAPAPITLHFQVKDPAGKYLPRSFTLDLPRSGEALFAPRAVRLYPSPTALAAPGSAVVRARVIRKGSREGLPWAVIQVDRVETVNGVEQRTTLARGLADQRGEAMVPVPRIPVTTWNGDGAGSVIASEIAIEITAGFDAEAGEVPDPEALIEALGTLPRAKRTGKKLASGQELTVPPMEIETLPP